MSDGKAVQTQIDPDARLAKIDWDIQIALITFKKKRHEKVTDWKGKSEAQASGRSYVVRSRIHLLQILFWVPPAASFWGFGRTVIVIGTAFVEALRSSVCVRTRAHPEGPVCRDDDPRRNTTLKVARIRLTAMRLISCSCLLPHLDVVAGECAMPLANHAGPVQ